MQNRIIGALWAKEKDGMNYMSGVINDIRGEVSIAVFPNNFKQAPNHPDYNIIVNNGEKRVKEPEPIKQVKKKKKADEIIKSMEDEVEF